MGGVITFILFLLAGLYIFKRLGDFAEESKRISLREEMLRETIRKEAQRQKLNQLYGREDESIREDHIPR